MPYIRLRKMHNASSFRRIAAAAWPDPNDPTIHAHFTVRAEALLEHLARLREQTGERLSPTHAVARALAVVLAKHPEMNGVVKHGGIYLRDTVDVFLQVAIPSGDDDLASVDLSGVKLSRVDRMDLAEISRELKRKAERVRADQDEAFKQTKSTLDLVPSWLLRPLLRVLDWLQFDLNLDLSRFGMPRDGFGSAMVSSVGMFGIQMALPPIFPPAHTPILLVVGALEDAPVVEDGELAVGKVLHLNASVDHRMIDGMQGSVLLRELRGLLERPALLDADV